MFLPERVSSLDNLVRIQKRVGKPLPVVLYPPENDQERSGTDLPFAEVTFQPTPEIMRKWQVSSVDGLLTQAKIRGYIKHSDEERKPALGYDLLHARALGEVSLNPWQETLPELLPFITELHIPVNRDDVKAPHLDIEGESRDLEEGTTKSEFSQILDMFRDYGWRGRVVIEAAPVNKPIDQWVVYHQKIATNIRQRLN